MAFVPASFYCNYFNSKINSCQYKFEKFSALSISSLNPNQGTEIKFEHIQTCSGLKTVLPILRLP